MRPGRGKNVCRVCNVYTTHLMEFHWKRTIRGHVVIIHGFGTHLHASIGCDVEIFN